MLGKQEETKAHRQETAQRNFSKTTNTQIYTSPRNRLQMSHTRRTELVTRSFPLNNGAQTTIIPSSGHLMTAIPPTPATTPRTTHIVLTQTENLTLIPQPHLESLLHIPRIKRLRTTPPFKHTCNIPIRTLPSTPELTFPHRTSRRQTFPIHNPRPPPSHPFRLIRPPHRRAPLHFHKRA